MNAWGATRMMSDDIASGLALRLEKPVVNDTHLDGRYDIDLKWSAEGQPANDDSATKAAPSIFTAVKDMLGLELRPIRGPVKVLVVDQAELPSAN